MTAFRNYIWMPSTQFLKAQVITPVKMGILKGNFAIALLFYTLNLHTKFIVFIVEIRDIHITQFLL